MSNSRQLDDGVLVRSYGLTFSLPTLSPPRSDLWDQLVYAVRGVVTVKTDEGTWVVPPHRAVWIPAGMRYSLAMSKETALRMIYLRKQQRFNSPTGIDRSRCSVVSVSALLRELIIRTAHIGALLASSPYHCRLAGLIEDEIRTIGAVPLQLPHPSSTVARKFAQSTLEPKAALVDCGASQRTMERLFKAETGMSLGQWLRRKRLLQSMEMLANGATIGSVAFTVGYSTPSSFIDMFRRELGSTPGEYLAQS